MSHTPQFITKDHISKLAEDPKNIVYEYTHDEATVKYNSQQQKELFEYIRLQYLNLRQHHPDWSDIRIREEMVKTENIKLFAENNGRIFDTCTSRDSTVDHLNHIRYMIYLRQQQELGNIDYATAQETVQNYLITQFKTNMSIQEYKEQLDKEKKMKKEKQQQKSKKR